MPQAKSSKRKTRAAGKSRPSLSERQIIQAMWRDDVEILDPTPISLPEGADVPETLQQQIQRMVRTELSKSAASAGLGTFDEEDDFEEEWDADTLPLTQYELQTMEPVPGYSLEPEKPVQGLSEPLTGRTEAVDVHSKANPPADTPQGQAPQELSRAEPDTTEG